jgi:phage/plasmid-like protein (TIGR03299 family)
MAHEVESMFFTTEGGTPWHGLGVELKNPPTAEEAIIAAGLDWEVQLQEMTIGSGALVPDHFATVRSTDSKVLGVVGSKYTPLQNKDAFGWFDPIIKTGRASYHTAGSLREGTLVWVLARYGNPIRVGDEDTVEKFLLLTTSHDGTRCVSALPTSVRVVCANTLRIAMASEKDMCRILHTASMASNLEEAQRALGMFDEQYAKLGEAFEAMSKRFVTHHEVREFVEELFPLDEEAKVTTRTENLRDNVIELFEYGAGAGLKTAKETAWGLYNAANALIHKGGVTKTAEKRLESSWFGQRARRDQAAFDLALALAA